MTEAQTCRVLEWGASLAVCSCPGRGCCWRQLCLQPVLGSGPCHQLPASRAGSPSPEMSRRQIWMLDLRSQCLRTFSPGSTFPPHLDCRCLAGLPEPWAASLKESQWWVSTASSGPCRPHPGLLVVTTRTQTRFSHQGLPSRIPALAPWPPAPTALPAPACCPHRAGLTHGCSPRDVVELSP